MAKVSSLTGEVVLNINKWTAGIKQVEKDAGVLQKSLSPLTSIASTAGTALLAIGTAAAAALATATKISADYGDKIRDASQRTGLATETLSGLKYQAEQTGASFEDLNSGLRFLSKNFSEAAATGKGKAAEAFNAIGVSVKDLRAANGQLEPVLRKVMDRIAEIPSASDRAAASMALLGKGGAQLTEFMSGGSAAMDEFRKKADLFGLTVGKDATDSADAFNDALNNLKQSFLGLTLTIGNHLTGPGAELLTWISAATVALKDLITGVDKAGVSWGTYARFTGELVVGTLEEMIPGFSSLTGKITENKKAIDAVTESEKKRLAVDKEAAVTLAEKEAREKAHLELVKKGLAEIEKIRKAALAEELKAYQQTMADEVTAAEHRYKVAMNLWAAEIKAKLAYLDAFDIAAAANAKKSQEVVKELDEQFKKGEDAAIASMQNREKIYQDAADQVGDVQESIARAAKSAASDTQRVWATAVGNITSDFAKGLSDVIFEGKKFGSAMKDLAKSTAKSMFDAFLTGLLTPLTSKLAKLGSDLGDILMGKSGSGGNSAFPGGGGGAGIGGILGSLGGGGGAGGSAGTAAKMNTLALGLGIANSAVDLFNKTIGKIGEGRNAANEIVKSQEAFSKSVGDILNDSSLSATNKSKIIDNLFGSFQQNSAAFAAGGGKNDIAANQAFATLAPWIAKVQAGLHSQMGDSSTVTAAAGSTVNNYSITINLSEGKNARATGALFVSEIIPAMLDAIRSNTGGLTAAITVGVKNSIAGVVTT